MYFTPGYLAEDAAKLETKFYKRDRKLHGRKNSGKNNLEDVFNRLMEISDPLFLSVSLETRIQKQQLKTMIPKMKKIKKYENNLHVFDY